MAELPPAFTALSPVETHGGFPVKRDDHLTVCGARGGKVRAAAAILAARPDGTGIVGFGGRRSNTAAAMAAACVVLGRTTAFHTAAGDDTDEMALAVRLGAFVTRHRPGYMSVLESRARADAAARGWPLGLGHNAAVEITAAQVGNLPRGIRRVVVPVGAGVTLAGVVRGLRRDDADARVLGVVVGAPPERRLLDLWEPRWRDFVGLVQTETSYDRPHPNPRLGELVLDPYYEAKAAEFLEPGDLLWVAGRR